MRRHAAREGEPRLAGLLCRLRCSTKTAFRAPHVTTRLGKPSPGIGRVPTMVSVTSKTPAEGNSSAARWTRSRTRRSRSSPAHSRSSMSSMCARRCSSPSGRMFSLCPRRTRLSDASGTRRRARRPVVGSNGRSRSKARATAGAPVPLSGRSGSRAAHRGVGPTRTLPRSSGSERTTSGLPSRRRQLRERPRGSG